MCSSDLLPIRTVSRTNPDFFTLAEEPWPVGGELTLRGGSVAGTTPNYSPDIDMSVPGVLNLAESGSNYNPELYYDWTTASNEYASVIYGVNTSRENKPLEVHWSTSVQQEGMPEKIAVPCLVQRYRIVYPNPDEAPQIVIASQKGGAGESYFETGNALFFDNENAHADLPSAVCFSADSAAISFYAKAERMSACSDANILSLASSNLTLSVRVSLGAGGITYKLVVRSPGIFQQVLAATPIAATSEWHCVTFALSSTNAVAYVDGASDISTAFGPIALDGSFTTNALGAVGTSKAPVGLALDSLALGTFSVEREADRWRTRATPQASDVSHTMCFTFPDGDLALREGTETRQITEEVSGRTCDVTGVLCMTPGAPHLGNGVFEADTQPVVYRQPDATKPGYNPNEEHAFIGSGSGGYFAWALRCDLNKDDTSEPGVLVQYVKDGRRAMKYYAVVLTNEVYSTLGAPATAGLALPGPHPLDTFDNPWLPDTYWDGTGSVSPAFRDRKLQVWARCAGTLDIHMYYPNQDGFDFTDGAAHPLREPVPWLSELNGGKPVAWTWAIDWPAHVETMRIGETLTVAANGLPEVWTCALPISARGLEREVDGGHLPRRRREDGAFVGSDGRTPHGRRIVRDARGAPQGLRIRPRGRQCDAQGRKVHVQGPPAVRRRPVLRERRACDVQLRLPRGRARLERGRVDPLSERPQRRREERHQGACPRRAREEGRVGQARRHAR